MSKILTKLNISDTVASVGGKCFKRLTTEEPLLAGLFDADNNLVASWDTLVNTYGMNCENNYTEQTYKTDTTSPYYVLTNNSELVNGVKLIIADGVLAIGKYSFYGLSSLTDIIIPDSVMYILYYAFSECSSLTNISLGNGVIAIDDGAFASCVSLTEINIPKNITYIGYRVFCGCTSLSRVTIPDSVTSIGMQAFYACPSLISITIPSSVTSIGDDAFLSCYKLVEIYNFSSLEITKGATTNGYAGYYALDIYTSADASSKLWTDFAGYIFYENDTTCHLVGCTDTESAELVLPDTCNGKNYTIYTYAFYDCRSVVSVVLSENITSIGEYAFYGIYSYGIQYGNAYYLGSAENSYFALIRYVKDDITSCSINSNTKIVAEEAFSACIGLASITIPNSVTYICDGAFNLCADMKRATIGSGVVKIGKRAFNNCVVLNTIRFNGTKAQWETIEKGASWDNSVPATYVTCSDGTVAI